MMKLHSKIELNYAILIILNFLSVKIMNNYLTINKEKTFYPAFKDGMILSQTNYIL